VRVSGTVRVDRRTKKLVTRLQPGDIAVIMHDDIDMLAAENLVACRPRAVINCSPSISGTYINRGPYLLIEAGIPLIDEAGEEVMKALVDGDFVRIQDGRIYLNGREIGSGAIVTERHLNLRNQMAKENLEAEIEKFADNTLKYMKKEKSLLYSNLNIPGLGNRFSGRQVLVVVRGPEYKQDLVAVKQYIREQRPVLIGVDGGADALIEEGYTPDVILGDMDSVSDEALKSGALLIVHAYESGNAPGMDRLKKMGLNCVAVPSMGTSEDLALLLANERGAELIVIVGSHFSMQEFLSKDREGMSSTFLTRLRVGSILVDAKGVSKLYQNKVSPGLIAYLIIAAAFPVAAIFLVSPLGPLAKQFVRLLRLFVNF